MNALSKKAFAVAPEALTEGTLCTGADGWFMYKEPRDLTIGGVSFKAVMGMTLVNKDRAGAFLAARTPDAIKRIKPVSAKEADAAMQKCFEILAKPGRAFGKNNQASERRLYAERTALPTGCTDPTVYADRIAQLSATLRNAESTEANLDMQNRFESATWAFAHLMHAIYDADTKDIQSELVRIFRWKWDDGFSLAAEMRALFPHKLKNVVIGNAAAPRVVKKPKPVPASTPSSPLEDISEEDAAAHLAPGETLAASYNIFLPDKFRAQIKELMAKRYPLPDTLQMGVKRLSGTERYIYLALHLTRTSYAQLTDNLNKFDRNFKISETTVREIAADAHVLTQHGIRIRGGQPLSATDMGVIRDAVKDPTILSNLNAAAGKLQPSYFFAYASRLMDSQVLMPLAHKARVDVAQFPLLYPAAAAWMDRYRNAPTPYIPQKAEKPAPIPVRRDPSPAARFTPLPAPKPAAAPKPFAAAAPRVVARADFARSVITKPSLRDYDKFTLVDTMLFSGFELRAYDRKYNPALIVAGDQFRELSGYELRLIRVLSLPKNWGKTVARDSLIADIGGNKSKLSTESHFLKGVLDKFQPDFMQITHAGIQLGSPYMPLPTRKTATDAVLDQPVNVEPAEPVVPKDNPFTASTSTRIYERGNFVLTTDDGQSHIHARVDGIVQAFPISRMAADIVKLISDPKNRGHLTLPSQMPQTTHDKFNGREISRELKPIFQKISPDDPIFFYVETLGFRLSNISATAAAATAPVILAGMKGP